MLTGNTLSLWLNKHIHPYICVCIYYIYIILTYWFWYYITDNYTVVSKSKESLRTTVKHQTTLNRINEKTNSNIDETDEQQQWWTQTNSLANTDEQPREHRPIIEITYIQHQEHGFFEDILIHLASLVKQLVNIQASVWKVVCSQIYLLTSNSWKLISCFHRYILVCR